MLRILVVGDFHAKIEDLDDCEKLAGVALSAIEQEKPDKVCFLGDQYDNFAVVNVVVEKWWMGFLDRLQVAPADRYLLVGNHDKPGDASQVAHAIQVHHHQAVVVDCCRPIADGIVALPFYFKAADFVAAATTGVVAQAKTLLCHQSFIGAKFESGQPIEAQHDPSAVDPAVIPHKCVIAGHIHNTQSSGKVWYPGSPRWRNNVSDANLDRFIYAIDFEDSLPKAIRRYPTGDICRRIWQVTITPEGTSIPVTQGKEGDRWVVDITGPAAFIEETKKTWSRPGVRMRVFQTDRPGPKLSESQGVEAAWRKWGSSYQPKYGTPNEILAQMAKDRLSL